MKSINLLPIFASFLVISLTYCQPKEEPTPEAPEAAVAEILPIAVNCLPDNLVIGSNTLVKPSTFTVSGVFIDPTHKLEITGFQITPSPGQPATYVGQLNVIQSADPNFNNDGYLMRSATLDIGTNDTNTTKFEFVVIEKKPEGEDVVLGRKKKGLIAHETTGHDKELE